MNLPYTPPLTAPATAGSIPTITRPLSAQALNQPHLRIHRCTSCHMPYPYTPFETSLTSDGSGQATWNIGKQCLNCTVPGKAKAIYGHHADAVEIEFLQLFPDGIHCIQNLYSIDPKTSATQIPRATIRNEDERNRQIEEHRRSKQLKTERRKEAKKRTQERIIARSEEVSRAIIANQTENRQADTVQIETQEAETQQTETRQTESQPSRTEDSPAVHGVQPPLQQEQSVQQPTAVTTQLTAAEMASAESRLLQEGIQQQIQRFQERHLLEQKGKDELIARERARLEERETAVRAIRERADREQSERQEQTRKANEMRFAKEAAARELRIAEAAFRELDSESTVQQSESQRFDHEQASRERIAREEVQERLRREQAQEQIRHQQVLDKLQREYTLEQAKREQAQDQARIEQARQEQLKREQASLHAKREQALEQARRERAEEQARQEQLKREQALQFAKREQALEQARKERAGEQARQEQLRRELAQQQAKREQALEQARRAEQIRMDQERAAKEAAERRDQLAREEAEKQSRRAQYSQNQTPVDDFSITGSRFQNMQTDQALPMPSSYQAQMPTSLPDTFPPQRLGDPSTQLVSPGIVMELQNAMIQVQSQIIATQAKLYALQSELNGPERSILKHVQHNLLTEQLQSMVNMYNKIQVQLAHLQQRPTQQPSYQRPMHSMPEQGNAHQPRSQPSHMPPNLPQVIQQPFQPQQPPLGQHSQSHQGRLAQTSSMAQQPVRTAGSPPGQQPPQQHSQPYGGVETQRFRQQHDEPNHLHSQQQGLASQQNLLQQLRQGEAQQHRQHQQQQQLRQQNTTQKPGPAATQSQTHSGEFESRVEQTLAEVPPQPSLKGQMPQQQERRLSKDRESFPLPLTQAPLQPRQQSLSMGHPKQPERQTIPDTQPQAQENPHTQIAPRGQMQNYLHLHAATAQSQLAAAQQYHRMQLAQLARPPMGMNGLSSALAMAPAPGGGDLQGILGPHGLEGVQERNQLSIGEHSDSQVPAPMDPSSLLIGDVHGIVPLPGQALEDSAARFTEVHESPNGKAASQPPSEVSPVQRHDQTRQIQAGLNGMTRNGHVPIQRNVPLAAMGGVSLAHGNTAEVGKPGAFGNPAPPPAPSVQQQLTSVDRGTSGGQSETAALERKEVHPPPLATEAAQNLPSTQTPVPVTASTTLHKQDNAVPEQSPTAPHIDIPSSTDLARTRTRQRSDSEDDEVVEERPTKRRRTDQSRFIPPQPDRPASPPARTRPTVQPFNGHQEPEGRPTWKTASDTPVPKGVTASATSPAVSEVPADPPQSAVQEASQSTRASTPSVATTDTTVNTPTSRASKASSVRQTLERVFEKNPHPSDAVFAKLATALKIEDVEPVKKLFALWRQNGHKPNFSTQS